MHNHKASDSSLSATASTFNPTCAATHDDQKNDNEHGSSQQDTCHLDEGIQDDSQIDDQQDDPDPVIPIIINTTTITRIPRSTLLEYTFHDNPPNPLILHTQTCPIAATNILTWLSTQPIAPRPLPRPFPWITFEEACQRWALAHALRIPRRLLGDELRDEIWLYVWSEPALEVEEFKMVVELCGFDGGLVRLACQRVRRRGTVGEELRALVGAAEGMLEERREQRIREGRVRL